MDIEWQLIAELQGGQNFEHVGDLKASDMADSQCRTIYAAIATEAIAGRPYDAVTLLDKLPRDVWNLGISAKIHAAWTCLGADHIAKAVKRNSVRRQLIAIASELHELAQSKAPIDEIKSKFELSLAQIESGQQYAISFKQAINSALEQVEKRAKGETGTKTGIQSIDDVIIGMNGGELFVLAARPAMGKTALALNICTHIAKTTGPVLIMSAEMQAGELAIRSLSSGSGANYGAIRKGQLDAEDYDAIHDWMIKNKNLPIYIDDRSAPSISHIASEARRIKRLHGIAAVMVDYIGLCKGEGRSRTEEVGSVSRALKGLAKDLNCPILALHQLNRNVDDRADKRPLMSDLRDSGEIEQDADAVAMLYRDVVYNQNTEHKDLAELIWRKSRGFAGDTSFMRWDGSRQKFTSTERPEQTQKPGGYNYK